ncbi:BPSL0067 family protein [Acidisphaera sp. L21]|uniref:BPSL0067 family protein n=1 Tax=Acidisphaera sp. L21 TaxID=1641851 RepID=UPI001C20509B|nr:BPSL0067 family protein [Acidisphaera sp. L21]
MVDPVQRPNPAPTIAQVRSDSTAPAFAMPEISDALIPSLAPYSLVALQHLLGIQEGQFGVAHGDATLQSGVSGTGPVNGRPIVATDIDRFMGRSVGSGQCVALVQAANPDIGSTHCWSGGTPVRGNTNLQAGTVIATFDSGNRYANHTDGSSHAAIYLGQNEQGIQVVDQWAGSTAAVRTIAWNTPGATAANTGSAFKVVESTHS